MSEAKTPGRAAYEAYRAALGLDLRWSRIGPTERAAWEAAAAAACGGSDG